MLKDKPILMNTFSVKGILEDRKTMTRRAIKPQPKYIQKLNDGRFETSIDGGFDMDVNYIKSPYLVGQHVYVKETYEILDYFKQEKTVDIKYIADGEIRKNIKLTKTEWGKYRRWKKMIGKKSSLYMFKSLARIWLLIEDVRVERVQDITEDDCLKEGIDMETDHGSLCINIEDSSYDNSLVNGSAVKTVFKKLWDSINGLKYPWRNNNYVWAYTFKRKDK